MSQNIDTGTETTGTETTGTETGLIDLFEIYLKLLMKYFYNPFCYKILSLSIDDLCNFFINSQIVTTTNTKNIYFQFPSNELSIDKSADLVINFLFINITPLYYFLTDDNYTHKSNLINNELDTKLYDNYKKTIIENDTEKVNSIYERIKKNKEYKNLNFKNLNKFISVKNFIDLLSFVLNDDNKYLLSRDNNILSNVIFNIIFKNIENFVLYCKSINDLFSQSKKTLKDNYIKTLDYYIDKQSSDTVLTFLKLRCDDFYNGNPIYNSRFKYKLYDNKIMKLHYNDDDENYYKYNNNGKEEPIDINNIKCAYKNEYFSKDKRITVSDNYNIPDDFYKQVYIFGQFSNIFEPNDDNNTIANKMKIVTESLLNKKPVFMIGYGASGAGKTSSLIYFNKKDEDGILVHLCNIMAQQYKYNKIQMKCREFYVNYLDKNNQELNENKKSEIQIRYIPGNKEKNKYFKFNYNNSDQKFKLILDDGIDKYIHKNNYVDKTYPEETTTFDKNTSLGQIVIHLIDNDRFVSATTNNPNSSRSHCLIFIKLLKDNNENDSATLIIGDFAGVENLFDCNSEKFQEDFFNVKRDDINKDEERLEKINNELNKTEEQISPEKREKLEKLKEKLSSTKEEKFYHTYPIKKYYEEYEKTYDKTNFQVKDVSKNIDTKNCSDKDTFKGFNNYPGKYEPYYESDSDKIKNKVKQIEEIIKKKIEEIKVINDKIKDENRNISTYEEEKKQKEIELNSENNKLKIIEQKRNEIEEYKKRDDSKIQEIEKSTLELNKQIIDNEIKLKQNESNIKPSNLPAVSEPDRKIINILNKFFIGKYIILFLQKKLKNEINLLLVKDKIIKDLQKFQDDKKYNNISVNTNTENLKNYKDDNIQKFINETENNINKKISEIEKLDFYSKIEKYTSNKTFDELLKILKITDTKNQLKNELKQNIFGEKFVNKIIVENYEKSTEEIKKFFENEITNITNVTNESVKELEKYMIIYNEILTNLLSNEYNIDNVKQNMLTLNNEITKLNDNISKSNENISTLNNEILKLNDEIKQQKIEKIKKEKEEKEKIDNDIYDKKNLISKINSDTNIDNLMKQLKFNDINDKLKNEFKNIKNDNDKLYDFIQKLKDNYEEENDFNYIIDIKQSSHGSDEYIVNLRKYFEEIFSKKPKKEDIKNDIKTIFEKIKEDKNQTIGYFINKKFNDINYSNQILLLKGIFGLSFPFKYKTLEELFKTKIIYNPENPDDSNNKNMFDIVYEHFQDNCNYINYIKMFIEQFNYIKTDYDEYMEEEYNTIRRNEYGKKVCQVRRNEGVFINDSLSKIRNLINYIIIQKNKNKLNISPPFVDECLNFYCEQGTCFKLKREKIYSQYENNLKDFNNMKITNDSPFNSVIFNVILEEIKEDINKLIVSIFCVFNISKKANNPPPVPYIDINLMKFYFYNKKIDSFLKEFNIFFNTYDESCKNKLCENLKNNNKNYLSVLCNYDKNKISNVLSSRIFQNLKQELKNINTNNLYTSYKPVIIEFFNYINNFNSASAIGTLEFIDSLSKYNTITNICNYKNLDKNKQNEIDKKYNFQKD
jgi:hypothetical protein